MTPAQLRVMRLAIEHRSIIIGGIDATEGVRRDTVRKLHAMGYLSWRAAASVHEESEWAPTEAGKAAVAAMKPKAPSTREPSLKIYPQCFVCRPNAVKQCSSCGHQFLRKVLPE